MSRSLALIWAPTAILWTAISAYGIAFPPPAFATQSRAENQSSSSWGFPNKPLLTDLKEIFEYPSAVLWNCFIVLSLASLLFARLAVKETRLKAYCLSLLFITAISIRCLSSFSGMMIWDLKGVCPSTPHAHICVRGEDDWTSILSGMAPWSGASLAKGFLLMLVVDWAGFWDRICLGWYDNEDHQEAISHQRVNRWFYSKWCDPDHIPSARDVVIRLAYFHIFDNIIHTMWLRYYYRKAPYTEYINNSEILTLVLAVQLFAWTFIKWRETSTTLAYLDKNFEAGQDKSYDVADSEDFEQSYPFTGNHEARCYIPGPMMQTPDHNYEYSTCEHCRVVPHVVDINGDLRCMGL